MTKLDRVKLGQTLAGAREVHSRCRAVATDLSGLERRLREQLDQLSAMRRVADEAVVQAETVVRKLMAFG